MQIVPVVAVAACIVLASAPLGAQTAKSLSQADVARITEVTQTFVKAALAKDWKTAAGLYTDDAVLNPPNEPAVKGRAAIQAWFEKFPPITEFKANPGKVEGREDMAYVWGTYTMSFTPPGAKAPVKDAGKFLEIRKRQADGRWLVAVDIFNSDAPPPPPAK